MLRLLKYTKKLINVLRYMSNELERKQRWVTQYPNLCIDANVDVDNVEFEDAAFVAHHAQISNAHIGNHSSIGRYDKIRETDMGRYCCVSWDVTIGAPSHPYKTITNSAITYWKEYGVVDFDANLPQKRTTIKNDVWIGCDVTIIAGCTIGNGAVIGAGAVVTKDIPDYEIWAGVPAKKIGQRFPDETIHELLNIKWWQWSNQEIKECLDLFEMELTMDVIKEIKERHGVL